jgi:CHASE2 domain-containing sensor protein/signal transduction histidine kinase
VKFRAPDILRNRVAEHVALMLLVLLVATTFVWNDVLWRWDNLIYDAQLSLWSRPAAQDIVIVAIDDQSLNDLGRWPWPRSLHALLLNKLQAEAPRAIGLDIIFSEPDIDNPQSDQALAAAIESSGRVVMPVYMSQASTHAVPLEALPLPEFTRHAAALGHVNLDISRDGIARRIFLREGIGEPHWLHYGLALLKLTGEARSIIERIEQATDTAADYSPMLWSREVPFLIPYAGPPGHFTRIGYSQVLSGVYPKDFFRDKIVLIGTTAEGMGDAFPTPLSGHSRNMPGVEIVANIIDALRNDLSISEIERPWQLAISLLLIALPLLAYPYVRPATTLLALFGFISSTILLVALLLWLFSIWLPASTILLFQLLSYPLWSWRRLDLALRHINSELEQLSQRQQSLSLQRNRNIGDELHFIKLFLPLKSWVLQDADGKPLLGEGTAPRCNLSQLEYARWRIDGHRYWALVNYQGQACQLGLSFGHGYTIDEHNHQLLDNLLTEDVLARAGEKAIVEDVLQSSIDQVKTAGNNYQQLRRIIDDSLSGMADGILICNGRGQIMLSNRRAAWYLCGDDDAVLQQQALPHLLAKIELKDGDNWKLLLQRVLFERQRILARAQHRSGRDLMIEISPLTLIDERLDGFIINLSDITLLKNSERKRDQILDFLSHDLRSPLSSMLAMIELARSKSSLGEMRAMLNVMEKNTEKTLHLAEQFLQLSRASTDEKIQFYELDFNNVVLNAIDQLWALSNKKNIRIDYQFEQEECWTLAEGDLLERAIVNLLSNAIKYSPADSDVLVRVSISQNEICCCVIDHGYGIDEAEIPHLFELFKRARGAGVERIQGIGLGLAFVDAVAKRHHGHVYVKSTLSKGSSFCLIIPLHPPA